MKIVDFKLSGVLLIEPDVYNDERGFFLETWHQSRYRDNHFPDVAFVQDNHSRSARGVLRGLHFQKDFPQGKLVQVCRGRVFDVAVDIRIGSPEFGRWVGHELSDDNHHQLWIPPGFAHGFCTLSDSADLMYKCTDIYRADDDFGITWDDPRIAVQWPISDPLLSDKDKELPTLSDVEKTGGLPVFQV
jgi:dTDP-4-dehydrorhamnose 3,5-epimerase